jgi:hypothetical protein
MMFYELKHFVVIFRNISMYIYSQMNGCIRSEYEEILAKLSLIEKEFYKQYDSSNHDRRDIEKTMENDAISCEFQ